MAKGTVNKVILIGHLGADPEVRNLPNGSSVANVSLATSDVWTDKKTQEQMERTEWHRVVFFNRLAEIAGEYLKKGAKIYVEGGNRTRAWEDDDGVKRHTTEIVASNMQMLSGRGGSATPEDNGPGQQQQSSAPASAPVEGGKSEDIPF